MTKISFKMEIYEIEAKKLLLLMNTSRRLLTSSLLLKLTNKRFQYGLQQK